MNVGQLQQNRAIREKQDEKDVKAVLEVLKAKKELYKVQTKEIIKYGKLSTRTVCSFFNESGKVISIESMFIIEDVINNIITYRQKEGVR